MHSHMHTHSLPGREGPICSFRGLELGMLTFTNRWLHLSTFMRYHAMPCHAMRCGRGPLPFCPAMPCRALFDLPCPAVTCRAVTCPALPCLFCPAQPEHNSAIATQLPFSASLCLLFVSPSRLLLYFFLLPSITEHFRG